jgi:hypothetical protein
MGWACDECGHAPHKGSGLGCLREDGNGRCGCTHGRDRKAELREIASAHSAVDRNDQYHNNLAKLDD